MVFRGTVKCPINSYRSFFCKTVPSSLSFTLNGHDYLDGQFRILEGEKVVAFCKAFDGRPAAQLTWVINKHRVNSSTHNISDILYPNANNQTFDVTSILTMKMNAPSNGTISCVSSYKRKFPSEILTVPYKIIGMYLKKLQGILTTGLSDKIYLFIRLKAGAVFSLVLLTIIRSNYTPCPLLQYS